MGVGLRKVSEFNFSTIYLIQNLYFLFFYTIYLIYNIMTKSTEFICSRCGGEVKHDEDDLYGIRNDLWICHDCLEEYF